MRRTAWRFSPSSGDAENEGLVDISFSLKSFYCIQKCIARFIEFALCVCVLRSSRNNSLGLMLVIRMTSFALHTNDTNSSFLLWWAFDSNVLIIIKTVCRNSIQSSSKLWLDNGFKVDVFLLYFNRYQSNLRYGKSSQFVRLSQQWEKCIFDSHQTVEVKWCSVVFTVHATPVTVRGTLLRVFIMVDAQEEVGSFVICTVVSNHTEGWCKKTGGHFSWYLRQCRLTDGFGPAGTFVFPLWENRFSVHVGR